MFKCSALRCCYAEVSTCSPVLSVNAFVDTMPDCDADNSCVESTAVDVLEKVVTGFVKQFFSLKAVGNKLYDRVTVQRHLTRLSDKHCCFTCYNTCCVKYWKNHKMYNGTSVIQKYFIDAETNIVVVS